MIHFIHSTQRWEGNEAHPKPNGLGFGCRIKWRLIKHLNVANLFIKCLFFLLKVKQSVIEGPGLGGMETLNF